jgi:hypothetical protein
VGFEKRVLRGIFRSEKQRVRLAKKIHNNFSRSPNFVRTILSRRIRWQCWQHRKEKFMLPKSWLKNLKGWDYFGGLSVNGRIILKRSENLIRGFELDSCDSGPRPLAGCVQGIEPSGSLTVSNILTSLAGISFLRPLRHKSLRNTTHFTNKNALTPLSTAWTRHC